MTSAYKTYPCPLCKKSLVFYDGDDEDCTSYVPDAGICCYCSAIWWFDEHSAKLAYGDDADPVDHAQLGYRADAWRMR